MTSFVNVVNGTAPGPGTTQTVTDSQAGGRTPKAIVMICSGHPNTVSQDVNSPGGRLSIGFYDLTNYRVIGAITEDGAAAGSADAGYRIDTATIAQLSNVTNANLQSEATVTSVGVGSVDLSWSAAATVDFIMLFIYGGAVQAAVESLACSGTIGGTATSTALGRMPDLVLAASCNAAFVADGQGTEMMVSFGAMARHSNTQGCVTTAMEHQQANTSVGSILRNDCVLTQVTSAAGTVTEGARMQMALTSTGFQITTQNANASFEGMFISLYLDGARCYVGTPTVAAGTTGSKAITGVGFKARSVLVAAPRAGAINNLLDTQNPVSIGAWDRTTAGCQGFWSRDNRATSEADSISSQTNLLSVLTQGASFDWVANPVSMDTDGLTINVSDAAAGDRMFLLVAFGEVLLDSLAWWPIGHRRWRRCLARR